MPREDTAIAVDKHEVKLVDGRNRSLGRHTGRLVVIAKILLVREGHVFIFQSEAKPRYAGSLATRTLEGHMRTRDSTYPTTPTC